MSLYQGPSPVLLPLTYADGKLLKIHYLNEKEVRTFPGITNNKMYGIFVLQAQLDVTDLLSKFLSVDIINDLSEN